MEERVRNLLDKLMIEQYDIEAHLRDAQNKGEFSKAIYFFDEWKISTIKINALKELLVISQ